MRSRSLLQIKILICLIGLSIVFPSLALSSGRLVKENNAQVRIAILKGKQEMSIELKSPYVISDPRSQSELQKGRRLKNLRIKVRPDGLEVGGDLYQLKKIRVTSHDNIGLLVDGKMYCYRGVVDILLLADHSLMAVNSIDLEEYIQGVLFHEVSHRWPLDALMTQAVATRTYALYQIEQNRAHDYDVTSDIYSQVYGGKNAERYRTNIAVRKTAGEILTFDGKILPAYFHATCAGHTEDARELWKHDELYPLKGVRCRFCQASPHYNWKKNFRLQEIQDKLNAKGYKLDSIADISIVSHNDSGRIKDLEITTRSGKKVTIPGKDFRIMIGPNIIRSNNYEVVMKGYYCDLIGHGWGHGVGMCQWGAKEMAQERYDYRQILAYYYPGSELIDYRKTNLFYKSTVSEDPSKPVDPTQPLPGTQPPANGEPTRGPSNQGRLEKSDSRPLTP